jgi:hypothetical protein
MPGLVQAGMRTDIFRSRAQELLGDHAREALEGGAFGGTGYLSCTGSPWLPCGRLTSHMPAGRAGHLGQTE